MVLPTDHVVYQSQEVAAVVATSRYIAADGVAAVDVDYEPLPVVIDPFKAMEPGSELVRPGQGEEVEPRLALGVGRPRRDRCGPRRLGRAHHRGHLHPAHPRGLDRDLRLHRRLGSGGGAPHRPHDVPGATRHQHRLQPGQQDPGAQDPDQDPRHRRRLRRQGAGLPRLRARRRRLAHHRQAGEMDRGPIREPPGRLVRPRLPHQRRARCDPRRQAHRAQGQDAGRQRRRRCGRQPVEVPGRAVQRRHRLVRPGRTRSSRSTASTPTSRPAASPIDAASASPRRCMPSSAWPTSPPTSSRSIRPSSGCATSSSRSSSRTSRPPAGSTTRATITPRCRTAMELIGYDDLRREQAEKRERGELMGIGISSFTEIVGAGPSHTFDILGIKMFDSCEIRVHPTGSATARIGVQTQGQGHETTFAQIIAEELGIPMEQVTIEYGDTDTAPYGLGTYASRSTPSRRCGNGHGVAQDPRQGEEDRRAPARGERGRPRVDERQVQREAGLRSRPRPSARSPSRPTRTTRRGWRPGWRRSTTTTRRT